MLRRLIVLVTMTSLMVVGLTACGGNEKKAESTTSNSK